MRDGGLPLELGKRLTAHGLQVGEIGQGVDENDEDSDESQRGAQACADLAFTLKAKARNLMAKLVELHHVLED